VLHFDVLDAQAGTYLPASVELARPLAGCPHVPRRGPRQYYVGEIVTGIDGDDEVLGLLPAADRADAERLLAGFRTAQPLPRPLFYWGSGTIVDR
jgi:hypothetical protein